MHFFRMRRRAKKTLRFRVTNAMVSVETSVLGAWARVSLARLPLQKKLGQLYPP